ncbi:hypothetical protein F4820DRAFT_335068 [Hypoxylon rubiginosum]|uniref:Uncharacterized protein n=1 Tax=Hypoxylon rubiginosum TaxID=110542 RepID=A0ACB9YYE6_9PEZI|nr:hypothetical protein F4820DRAFT_335068 [Hypoxylon rubiginosum]
MPSSPYLNSTLIPPLFHCPQSTACKCRLIIPIISQSFAILLILILRVHTYQFGKSSQVLYLYKDSCREPLSVFYFCILATGNWQLVTGYPWWYSISAIYSPLPQPTIIASLPYSTLHLTLSNTPRISY